MTNGLAYIDYNATAPLRAEARAAFLSATESPGNASSVHGYGRRARGLIEAARKSLAAFAGAEPSEVVFTSGGTEANNIALGSMMSGALPTASLIVSSIEHSSILAPAERIAKAQRPVFTAPALASGLIDLAALEKLLAEAPRPALVAVMLANNETGAIQPLREVAALVRAAGGYLLCDAVQAAGKMALDFAALGADMMTLSGHKIGAPAGIGALILRADLPQIAGQVGGGQEQGRRAGTENLAGIAAFGAAAEAARRDMQHLARLQALRDGLQARLLEAAPAAPVYAAEVPRLGNTLCIGMPGVAAEIQVMALDLAGIAVSAGAACSSGKVTPSHVLGAMGAAEAPAREAIRFSFGWDSTAEDMERAASAWIALFRRKRAA